MSVPRFVSSPVILVFCLALASPALAGTYFVDTTADDASLTGCNTAVPDDCSLRGAVLAANADLPNPSAIALSEELYLLTVPGVGESAGLTGDLNLAPGSALTIVGVGIDRSLIRGTHGDRLIGLAGPGSLTLRSLTLDEGEVNEENGGCISVTGDGFGGTELVVDDVLFRGCNAYGGRGGAIYAYGADLTLDRVEVVGGKAWRGGAVALYGASAFVATDSVLRSNVASGDGGALYVDTSSADIERSLVAGNVASSGGGGAFLTASTGIASLDVANSTLSGNSAATGGAIRVASGNGLFSLRQATLTGNVGAATIAGSALGTFTMQNSVMDGSCFLVGTPSVFTSGNLETGDSCGLDPSENQLGVDPADLALAALAWNGGATDTHALLAGSVAIDSADPARCLAEDQRGAARDALCDVGAYEADAAACFDADGDGYGLPGSAACAGGPEADCDDANPDVNPGRVETIGNGIDDDCDPSTPDEPAGCSVSSAAHAEGGATAARGAPILLGLAALWLARRRADR